MDLLTHRKFANGSYLLVVRVGESTDADTGQVTYDDREYRWAPCPPGWGGGETAYTKMYLRELKLLLAQETAAADDGAALAGEGSTL